MALREQSFQGIQRARGFARFGEPGIDLKLLPQESLAETSQAKQCEPEQGYCAGGVGHWRRWIIIVAAGSALRVVGKRGEVVDGDVSPPFHDRIVEIEVNGVDAEQVPDVDGEGLVEHTCACAWPARIILSIVRRYLPAEGERDFSVVGGINVMRGNVSREQIGDRERWKPIVHVGRRVGRAINVKRPDVGRWRRLVLARVKGSGNVKGFGAGHASLRVEKGVKRKGGALGDNSLVAIIVDAAANIELES